MSELTPSQARTRERVESLIGFVAPALDLILVVGDRMSRIVQPEDHDYYPVRPVGELEPVLGSGDRPKTSSPDGAQR